MDLLHACLDMFKKSQLAVYQRALGMADIFDKAISDSFDAIRGFYPSSRTDRQYYYYWTDDAADHQHIGSGWKENLLEGLSHGHFYYSFTVTATVCSIFVLYKLWKKFNTCTVTTGRNGTAPLPIRGPTKGPSRGSTKGLTKGPIRSPTRGPTKDLINNECIQTEWSKVSCDNSTFGQQDQIYTQPRTMLPTDRTGPSPMVHNNSQNIKASDTPTEPHKYPRTKSECTNDLSLVCLTKNRSESRRRPCRPKRRKTTQSSPLNVRQDTHTLQQTSRAREAAGPVKTQGLPRVQSFSGTRYTPKRHQPAISSLSQRRPVDSKDTRCKKGKSVVQIHPLPKRKQPGKTSLRRERRGGGTADDPKGRKEYRSTTATNWPSLRANLVYKNITGTRNKLLNSLTTFPTNPLPTVAKEPNVTEQKEKERIRSQNKVYVNRYKKIKTCNEYRKVTPTKSTSKCLAFPQSNKCSLFYYVPKSMPNPPLFAHDGDLSITVNTNTTRLTNALGGTNAFQPRNNSIEDTNMNKSGIGFDIGVNRNDDLRFVGDGNHNTVYKAATMPLIQIPKIQTTTYRSKKPVPFDNGTDQIVPTTKSKQSRDNRTGNRMAENGKTSYQFYSEPFRCVPDTRDTERCRGHGNEVCAGDWKGSQQSVKYKQNTNDCTYYDVDSIITDHTYVKSDDNGLGGENVSKRHTAPRTGRLLYKRTQLRRETRIKCPRCRSKHPHKMNCFTQKKARCCPTGTSRSTRTFMCSGINGVNMDTSDSVSTDIFYNNTEKSGGSAFPNADKDMRDATTFMPKDLKFLNKNMPVWYQEDNNHVTSRRNREKVRDFGLDRKTGVFIKRCDKIKSNKWRQRHEPYTIVCPKQPRTIPSTKSSDVIFPVRAPDLFRYELTASNPVSKSDSGDVCNTALDSISVSTRSPQNKNNCSPSRKGCNMKTMTGSQQDVIPHLLGSTVNYNRCPHVVDASSPKGSREPEAPRLAVNRKYYIDEENKQTRIQAPSTLHRQHDFQPDTLSPREQFGFSYKSTNTDTLKNFDQLSNVQRSDDRTQGQVKGLTVSEGSSTTTTESHRKRRRWCLKEKRWRYPNCYKKSGGLRMDNWLTNTVPCSRDKVPSFASLGIQTSDVSLHNTAVQTSPAMAVETNPALGVMMPSTRQTETPFNKRKRSPVVSSGKLISNRNYCSYLTSDSNTLGLESKHGEQPPLFSLNQFQVNQNNFPDTNVHANDTTNPYPNTVVSYGRNQREVIQGTGRVFHDTINNTYATSDISGMTDKNYGIATEPTLLAPSDIVEVNDCSTTVSRYGNPTHQNPVKEMSRNPSTVPPVCKSLDDVKDDYVIASSSGSNKSWVARPRWEDANVEEINRRVEKALRLRQELQRCRNSKSGLLPQNSIIPLLKPDECTAQILNKSHPTSCLKMEMEKDRTIHRTTSGCDTKIQQNHVKTNMAFDPSKYVLRNSHPDDVNDREVSFPCLTAKTDDKSPSAEDGENLTSDITDTLCTTQPFNLRRTESLTETGDGHWKLFEGRSPKRNTTTAAEKEDSTVKPNRSHSFHDDVSFTPITSIEARPFSVSSMSCVPTTTHDAENHKHHPARQHGNPNKTSPPVRISRMENVIQSQYPKLVGELVQALPQVPLSTFVEWFIETSHPGHNFVISDISTSPDIKPDSKTVTNDMNSVSTDNDQCLFTSDQNPTSNSAVDQELLFAAACVEIGDNNRLAKSHAHSGDVKRSDMPCESSTVGMECVFGGGTAGRVGNAGENNTQSKLPSIRRILLTRTEQDVESSFGSSATTNENKRRGVSIVHHSYDTSATVTDKHNVSTANKHRS